MNEYQLDFSEEFCVMLHIIDVALGTIGKEVENGMNAVSVINESMILKKYLLN